MSSSPFLKLPPELRRSIYHLVLVREQQPLRPKTWGRRSRPTGQLTAILLTNRAIYHEAHPILHSENKFEIDASSSSHRWLDRLSSRSRSELRNLKFLASDGEGYPPFGISLSIFSLLSKCANLALTIDVHMEDLEFFQQNRILNHMHGFGQSSKGPTKDTTGEDCLHSDFPKTDLHERGDAVLESILRQFTSTCPPRCRAHGKVKMRPKASVSVEIDKTCEWCRFLRYPVEISPE